MRLRFTNDPGSPSSALQIRYFGLRLALCRNSHFKPVEKAAPVPTKHEAAAARKEAAKKEAEPAGVAAAPETSVEPTGQGYAVQIAALNVRGEAEAIAKRLSSKGYAAYVLSPTSGTPTVFRVRVGKFGTRREAETVAAKLQKEEQFKPWITR